MLNEQVGVDQHQFEENWSLSVVHSGSENHTALETTLYPHHNHASILSQLNYAKLTWRRACYDHIMQQRAHSNVDQLAIAFRNKSDSGISCPFRKIDWEAVIKRTRTPYTHAYPRCAYSVHRSLLYAYLQHTIIRTGSNYCDPVSYLQIAYM